MINPFKDVNWNPGPAEKRKFAISLVLGFPIVAVSLFLIKGLISHAWNPLPSYWIGGVGCGLGLLFLAMPVLAKPFYVVWYFFGCCIGIVVSNVLLSVFYFIAVTALGLILRMVGKEPIQKKLRRDAKTYWLDAERITDPKRYYQQF